MNAPAGYPSERVLTSLLLAVLIIAGVALLREGPQFDNVIDGWRFFTLAFFSGALAGFLGWTRMFNVVPTLKLSGAHRHPWLAALALGLVCAAGASYFNRTFATPTGRSITVEVDSVAETKSDRWSLIVKTPDGHYQRYLISRDVATALKNEKTARLSISRGALGFEFIASFEPVRP